MTFERVTHSSNSQTNVRILLSTLDSTSAGLLRRSAVVLSPVLSLMCNASLRSGMFPNLHKHAVVFPRLKKPSLDADDLNSHRPISNFTFVSKLMERVAACRCVDHAEQNKLLPVTQSAYRRHHSTESSVVKVMKDIIRSIDDGKVVPSCWFYLTSVRRLIPLTMTFCLKYYRIASRSTILQFRCSTRT